MERIHQFDIWIADLNPRMGTEAGKRRPVVVLQTDLLNESGHPSTIICPLTTNVQPQSKILRVGLIAGDNGLNEDCDIMMDQIRAIDNQRLIKRIGSLSESSKEKVLNNLAILLDI
ncbi:type II toxin-antitoxin system PemK/MazF family toxin [Gracilimonas mengyeensis]|uniref:mRNA interferase n=1 Tax=Gracilimonas mengyeensis TaxID=1302730 RepID=A0A521F4V6_9BACT|nr:type II toxin-antitoxin system PemK/MazF family toxin [Gracilimonas mengyeensis]SMO91205.1 mRNA interferase MazF [Gracilimonas mengyeensis]